MDTIYLMFNLKDTQDAPARSFKLTFHAAAVLICRYNNIKFRDVISVFDYLTSTYDLKIPPSLKGRKIITTKSHPLMKNHKMVLKFLRGA